jgi:hypothetical protein
MDTNHIRAQRRGQSARQAMMISGLNTIYRNTSSTYHIQAKQRTEPRIYFLDITLDEMNTRYPNIRQIIERGRLRSKGNETFFVTTHMEHFILCDNAMFEIRSRRSDAGVADAKMASAVLYEYIPVDGRTTTIEIDGQITIPVLLDESYYIIESSPSPSPSPSPASSNHDDTRFRAILSSHHIVIRRVKKVIKTHPKSMNAFVFILNEDETSVIDFYMTTENGVSTHTHAHAHAHAHADACVNDRITRTCKEDIISFIEHFKLCS